MVLRITIALAVIALSACSTNSPNGTNDYRAGCTIKSAKDVDRVLASCKTITVGSFAMTAGVPLKLFLQSGSTLTFTGDLGFAYAEWGGPLIWIKGEGITVQGDSNHLINARGEKWWDGKGGHSSLKKPRVMEIQATGNSVIKGLKIKNCPLTCVGISNSHDLTIQDFNIDSKDGDTHGGANTDGFDLGKSYKITIKDSTVWNQDDCVCINGGQHMIFDNIKCTGGHGLSIASGIWSDYDDNKVYNVTFKNSIVQNSRNGIHIKTIPGSETGEITSVTYENIKMIDITYNAISIQQDYTNDGSTGNPQGNIPIKHLTLNDVYGTMTGKYAQEYYVLCASGACTNWNFNGVHITGGQRSNSCNYKPSNFKC